jgi:hypothetical protein
VLKERSWNTSTNMKSSKAADKIRGNTSAEGGLAGMKTMTSREFRAQQKMGQDEERRRVLEVRDKMLYTALAILALTTLHSLYWR